MNLVIAYKFSRLSLTFTSLLIIFSTSKTSKYKLST